jgi:hypothetical protein
MKTRKLIAEFSVVLLAMVSAQAQGTFKNLNFELANPGSGTYAFNVPVASALPHWSVYYGNVQQTTINFNETSTGATVVTLISTADSVFPAIDGNYSVLLQGGITASDAAISQTAVIPSGMQSLLFEAQPGLGPLDISIGTQTIPFEAIGTGENYTLFGANISTWSGNDEQLTFAALEDSSAFNNWLVDDISFSSNSVPEPSIVALSAMGGLLFGGRKWLARRC